jgi:hypothetical protein
VVLFTSARGPHALGVRIGFLATTRLLAGNRIRALVPDAIPRMYQLANILTVVMAFCLIGSGSNRATRQGHFVQPIVENATAESAVTDTAFLAVHRNEQTEDRKDDH